MEHIFVLSSITHKKEEEKQLWKYKYKLMKPGMEKAVEIVMETKDPISAYDNTGLPVELGDVVTVDVGAVNTQGKLDLDGKGAEE